MTVRTSKTKIGSAFAPGHVTGFFQICDVSPNLLQKGSKGVGICLSKGVFTSVEFKPISTGSGILELIENGSDASVDAKYMSNFPGIEIYFNSEKIHDAATTFKTAQKVLRLAYEKGHLDTDLQLRITSSLELPAGQGFGISGAGALSAALAINNALNIDLAHTELIAAAHEAEIEQRTGLGDVVAQAYGGIPIRQAPGCAPYGKITQLDWNSQNMKLEDLTILLCVIGDRLDTKTVLSNPTTRNSINKYGETSLKNFLNAPTIENLFNISFEFALSTNLISENVLKAAETVHQLGGLASMAMLGNAVFAIGYPTVKEVVETLNKIGKVHVCKIDRTGAKCLDVWR